MSALGVTEEPWPLGSSSCLSGSNPLPILSTQATVGTSPGSELAGLWTWAHVSFAVCADFPKLSCDFHQDPSWTSNHSVHFRDLWLENNCLFGEFSGYQPSATFPGNTSSCSGSPGEPRELWMALSGSSSCPHNSPLR